jgi:hypothetical protein
MKILRFYRAAKVILGLNHRRDAFQAAGKTPDNPI